MVMIGALKVLRLRVVPLERLLARVNKASPGGSSSAAATASAIPLKDRVLSSHLLLHGDPSDWLRRGAAPGTTTARGAGSLFLVPTSALRRVIATESSGAAKDSQQDELEPKQMHEEGRASPSSPVPLAVAASPPSAALALLESGEGYRITLLGLLAQAQQQQQHLPSQSADASSLLAQTVRGLAVVEEEEEEEGSGSTKAQEKGQGQAQQTERERKAFTAVREGDLATLRSLLDEDPSLALTARHPEHGGSLLHVAVARPPPRTSGSVEGGRVGGGELVEEAEEGEGGEGLRLLDALLDAGADPDARAANGSTALHWAAGNGHVAAVRKLLERGADAHASTRTWGRSVTGKASGQTPCHWAAESGWLGVVRVLGEHAPLSLVLPDERGRTPRALALLAGGGKGAAGAAAVLEEAEREEWVVVEARVEAEAVRVLKENEGGQGLVTG